MIAARLPYFAAASALSMLMVSAGCVTSTQAPAAPPVAMVSGSVASTQPMISSCVNDASVEFDSSWSTFRFAEQSNSVTVNLTGSAFPQAPASAPASLPSTRPSGGSQADINRGAATPEAIRGDASTDAVRGWAHADAERGSAIAEDARGTAPADAARGSFTVQVLRGSSESLSARHDNSSSVVRPDLTIEIEADPPLAAPGDTVVYTITLKNISNIEARDLTVTDYLPEQMEFLSARGATITIDPDDTSTHLSVPGAIPPGQSVQVQLLARVKPFAGKS